MLIDLHAKTSISDEVDVSLRDVLDRAAEEGLDAVAFCETESTAYAERVLEIAEDFDVDAFIGVEIRTDTGLLLGFVPSVDEFYENEEWRRYTDLVLPTPEAVIQLFEDRGGAVVAARPFDRETDFPMGDHIFELENLDAVEVVNSRVEQVHNDFAVEAATYLGKSTVGGSDPADSVEPVGQFGTYVDGDVDTQADLVDALRSGNYWAVELADDV